MNYELAKQLKNAGFSQQKGRGYYLPDAAASGSQDDVFKKEFVYIPTLEELIDEMPMRRKDLGTVNDAHFVLRKLVSTDKNSYWTYMEDEDTNKEIEGYIFRNEPADVVVAKLWLALNNNMGITGG